MVRKIKKKGGDDSAPQDDLNLESDAFLDAASESIEWAEDHRSGVIGGIIAVAVAVALGFGYTQYEASANQMPPLHCKALIFAKHRLLMPAKHSQHLKTIRRLSQKMRAMRR